MALNIKKGLIDAGVELYVYDVNKEAVQVAVAEGGAIMVSSPREMGEKCDIVVSMVPNDEILRHVVSNPDTGLLAASSSCKKGIIHVGCSTVHPDTSRDIAKMHADCGSKYVGAPVFARADGVAQRAASIVVGGDGAAIDEVMPVLNSMAAKGIFRFGDDPGAGNVVKLCGNFMIGAAIESCAEACSMAEKNGLDRVAVMNMLTSTIFDCLIYKGYGMRTAHRQHVPNQPMVGPGFQLSLGLKDVALTRDVASKVEAPMPFCSVLHDRFLASQARGRGQMDWSALALLSSEEAGVDVSDWLPGGKKAAESGDAIAPM